MKFLNSLSLNRFSILLTTIYCCFALFGILHHVMWRDELEGWMIAREAHTFSELFQNLRYQGHPGLWHILLFPLGRFTQNPLAMQLLHFVIAAIVVFLFAFYSPFPRIQKILFVFGYYAFFEYCLMSRNYAIGVLILFIICIVHDKNRYVLAILIGLLANTNVYMTIVSGSIYFAFFIHPLFQKEGRQNILRNTILPSYIIFNFFVCAIIQLKPPSDSVILVHYHTEFNLLEIRRITAGFFESFMTIPRMGRIHFWETMLFVDWNIMDILALLILFMTYKFILKDSKFRWMFFLGIGVIAVFNYLVFPNYSNRHIGAYFMLWIAAIWMSTKNENSELFHLKASKYFISGVFVCGFIGGIYSYGICLTYPFSDSKEAADYLLKNNLAHENLIGVNDFAASSIAGYLNRPIYYPERGHSATFMVWDGNKKWGISSEDLEKQILQSMTKYPDKKSIFICNYILKDTFKTIKYKQLKEFTEPIVESEWFRLYEINRISN